MSFATIAMTVLVSFSVIVITNSPVALAESGQALAGIQTRSLTPATGRAVRHSRSLLSRIGPAQDIRPPTHRGLGGNVGSSGNWAGWVASGTSGFVSSAQDKFIIPNPKCAQTPNSFASFWAGLDGWLSTDNTVEQAGVQIYCASTGLPQFNAWYEMFPADEVFFPMTVSAGDSIVASVTYTSGSYLLKVKDTTTGVTDSTTQTAIDQNASAECIAEDPGVPQDPYAAYESVSFSQCEANGVAIGTALLGAFQVNMTNPVGDTATASGLTKKTRFSVSEYLPPPTWLAAAQDATTGDLDVFSSSYGEDSTGLGIDPGTSPSITALPGGSWEAAWVGLGTGHLDVYSSSTGSADTGEAVAAGTSPSITAIGSAWYAAWVGYGTGHLDVFSSSTGGYDTGDGVAAGTSPSITTVGTTWEAAWVGLGTNHLDAFSSSTGGYDSGEAVDPGTSPSIAAAGTTAWDAAWVGYGTGHLDVFSSSTGGYDTGDGVASGTSPSIT